ncbi:GCVT [Blepharisma stoltei]|uniref:Aminomethyltransferase n=1 Tax=Blepharisma stoltei TaxID=1481888 RepID=A0AAU9IRW1_9CILI|nr:unnamed protein product [Blepharisma stoltei]
MLMATLRRFSTGALKKTALFDFHANDLQAKMVPFAGYEMPVEYKERSGGVLKEHMQCRQKAALFDVSHMGQLKIRGRDRVEFINYLTVADLNQVPANSAVLSLIMMSYGGIKDDTIITRFEDHIGMVINAGCKDKDLEYLNHFLQEFRNKGKDVTIEHLEDRALLALQGPMAAGILQPLVEADLATTKFMQARYTQLKPLNEPVLVTRCGYTGEDGFEISIDPSKAVDLARILLSAGGENLLPCGLGARDSLRLEAGMCLYGHDLEENITPIEASLLWTIPKTKRTNGGWLGADTVMQQIRDGTQKKRVGFIVQDGPSAREGVVLYSGAEEVGKVSSGTFSPILKKGIGMAYVNSQHAKTGLEYEAKIRPNKSVQVKIEKMPFVPNNYYK